MMPRASLIMGEYVDLSALQPSLSAAQTRPSICLVVPVFDTSILNARLYILWSVFRFGLPLVLPSTYMRSPSDIKPNHIMFGIADDSFSATGRAGAHSSCPRKELDRRIIYVSRELRMPRVWSAPVLCDFGSGVSSGIGHSEGIQPNIYRTPEVIVEVPWTYSVDVWDV